MTVKLPATYSEARAPLTVMKPDKDATEIGALYRKARRSLVESVHFALACGQRLTAKRGALNHGGWFPWLRDNADVLGFDAPRTAQRLMKLAANATLPSHMDEATALTISRQLWGNNEDEHDRDDEGLLCDEDGLPRDADGKVTPDAKKIVKAITASEAVEADGFPASTAVNDQDIVPKRSKQHQADFNALTAKIRDLEQAGSLFDLKRDNAEDIAAAVVGNISEHKARKIAEAIVARLDARKSKKGDGGGALVRQALPGGAS